MISDFLDIHKLLTSKTIKLTNEKLNRAIQNYSFLHADNLNDIPHYYQLIHNNFNQSNCILLTQNKNILLAGFKNTIIITYKHLSSILQKVFSTKDNLIIYLLTDIKDVNFDFNCKIEKAYLNQFKNEIENFNKHFSLHNSYSTELKNAWGIILPCISGYLIKESYEKTNINRLENMLHPKSSPVPTFSDKTINPDDFIELRKLGFGSFSLVSLVYHIENQELLAIKSMHQNSNDLLFQREVSNYSKIDHPFLPKFIGMNSKKKYFAIEFINGITLSNIKDIHLNYNEKITIIFELMITIEYLHRNHFIFRDLKPNNIILDSHKTIVLLDFDRMIKFENIKDASTLDFASFYIAPEIYTSNFSYKCDIYSLGLIIYYIMELNDPTEDIIKKYVNSKDSKDEIKNIIKNCINRNENKRASILELILDFYIKFKDKIQIENIFQNYIEKFNDYYNFKQYKPNDFISFESYLNILFFLGYIYLKFENIKAINYFKIAADLNHKDSQYYLGILFLKVELFPQNISKAIHYFTLAANNNLVDSQVKLGLIYLEGKIVQPDIEKSIHYYTLAAYQNSVIAQYNLGIIYSKGELVPRNISKAIHYFTLAANNNLVDAQVKLGFIYGEGKIVQPDIEKSIHYYTLAAYQNSAIAQYNLGITYLKIDIKKSLYYLELAANQNYIDAQNILGEIYYDNTFIPRNINKAINYFTLAANNNCLKAQVSLGEIYYEKLFVSQDILKAVHYYSLAAKQNDSDAQYFLGIIYYQGKSVSRNLKKSLYYLNLSADQNNPYAQYVLGYIYLFDKSIPRDINKALLYFQHAANQNLVEAQYILGYLYLYDYLIQQDIDKAIYYLTLASKQNHKLAQYLLGAINYELYFDQKHQNQGINYFIQSSNEDYPYSNFILGYMYHFGMSVKQDIKMAISYYKKASSFNLSYAKNNLGIIYKKGIDGLIDKNISYAIEYFNEAIKQKNDYVSMYNLAHLLIYEELDKSYIKMLMDEDSITTAIKLLIKSSIFFPSRFLLCLVSIMEFGIDTNDIVDNLNKIEPISRELSKSLCEIIRYKNLDDIENFEENFNIYHDTDYIYFYQYTAIELKYAIKASETFRKQEMELERKKINSFFYEGFGIDL